MDSRFKWIYLFGLLFILTWAGIIAFAIQQLGFFGDRISPGVYCLGVNVGLLKVQDAEKRIKNETNLLNSVRIELTNGKAKYYSTLYELGYRIDADKLFNTVKSFGENGTFIRKLKDRYRARQSGVNISVRDSAILTPTSFMEDLADMNKIPVRNAYWKISWGDQDIPVKERPGYIIDRVRLKNKVSRALDEASMAAKLKDSKHRNGFAGIFAQKTLNDTGIGNHPIRIHIPMKAAKPKIFLEDIIHMKPLASFTTEFDPKVVNRVHNIRLAIQRLLGEYIEPDSTWSLNKAVGPREEKQGFKEALVIQEGKFVTGIGGGVSQVATTVFNCSLLAGLEVPEHYSHTVPITYVPFGRDATAVYGQKDLKVKNTTHGLISMTGAVKDTKVQVKFYGFKDKDIAVAINPIVIEKYDMQTEVVEDDSIRQGYTVVDQKGLSGYRIAIERTMHDAQGNLIEKKVVAKGWYRMIPEKVRLGVNPEGIIPTSAIESAVKDSNPAMNKPGKGKDIRPKRNAVTKYEPSKNVVSKLKSIPGMFRGLLKDMARDQERNRAN